MTYALITDLKATIPNRDLELLSDMDGAVSTVDDARVVCRDLAVHRLYANVGRVTETQDKLRDSALAYLRMVRDGKMSIGDADGGAEIQTSDGSMTIEGPDRVMSRDSLRNF